MSKIIFVVQHLGQPRCIKRIKTIKEAGFNVEVFGMDWGVYSDNIKSYGDIAIRKIVKTKGLSKIQKIKEYYSLIKAAEKATNKGDIIYAFGFEMATMVHYFTKNRYVYELADVVAARENSKILKYIDKKNIENSIFTVITSEGFAEYFYGNEYEKLIGNKFVLLPNKLSTHFNSFKRDFEDKPNIDKIRFGFVGLFRFLSIYLNFAQIIGEKFPNHEFHFWGDGNDTDKEQIIELTKKYNNVFLHGKFANPNDLPKVYETIDINVVCYNNSSGNVKIAEPNKLYESIYFCKPMLVSNGTFLQRKVEKMKIGFCIDSKNNNEIINFISSIDAKQIEACINNERSIESEELIDNPALLVDKLSKYCK